MADPGGLRGGERYGRLGIQAAKRGITVAHERSTALHTLAPKRSTRERDAPDDGRAALTPAEVHALRRSAPLTPVQFKTLRRLAEQGVSPLRHL